jgi:hydroxymethylglutaryl-CoA lyase
MPNTETPGTPGTPGREPITLQEVGLRDGLQNEAAFVPTAEKVALAGILADAGLRRIELTSFVSPRWIPQLADHALFASSLDRRAGVVYSALVPNRTGLDGASEAKLPAIAVFLSASETHTKKNINKTIGHALEVLGDVAVEARARGMQVRAYLSTVFGCPFEGKVDPERVVDLTLRLLAMGAFEVSLGDTIGVANPRQVDQLLGRLYREREITPDRLALHMHDTRGTALANVLAGLEAGIRTFDSAFGGLGGCPYAPGAAGNLATEDLVYMLEEMGYDTGVNLDRLVDASIAVGRLVGRALPSKVLQVAIAQRAKAESASHKAASGSGR